MTESAVSDRFPRLARTPSDASLTAPPHGAWCAPAMARAGGRSGRRPKGWRCMTSHPPDHMTREANRRERELVAIPDRQAADPLFRQEEIDPDWRS